MKSFFALSLIVLLTSCTAKMIPIRGSYPEPPITESTQTPIDSVWSNLIDYIAQKGMSIKVIDKSSWLLVTEDYSFEGAYSHENKKGVLVDPKALVVTSAIRAVNTNQGYIGPDRVLGNWNVRLKPNGNGTLINVNLTNLRTFDYNSSSRGGQYTERTYQIKTTGIFERTIIENIK